MTIIDFRKYVVGNHAGPPDSYSGIVIPIWQEISEETFNSIQDEFGKLDESELQNIYEA